MDFVRLPWIVRRLYPGAVCHIPGEKSIYLSFDDGPTPVVTGQVLEILKSFRATATFFCIGRNAERNPEIMDKIRAGNHRTGNHTYSHLKGWYTPNREYYEDIDLASRFVPSSLFRPAYGMITPVQARHLKKYFTLVLWDVMSYDFHPGTSREKCLDHVIRHTRQGSVVVFHDSLKASEKLLYALPRMLEHFSRLGYSFEVLPER
jgi:peptidoglycan/xylan/chitin deacetylase (PgdA/CDA1 family)